MGEQAHEFFPYLQAQPVVWLVVAVAVLLAVGVCIGGRS